MAFRPSLTQKTTRIRIQSIDINLQTQTKHPICLKLLLNDQVHQLLREVAVGQPLYWDNIDPLDAKGSDRIELRGYEAHIFRRKIRIVTIKRRAQEFDHLLTELQLEDNSGLVPCSIRFTFMHPDAASNPKITYRVSYVDSQVQTPFAPHMAQKSAAAAADLNPSVLECMGKAHDFIDAILKIGVHLSELNPIAKVTLGLCKQAWECLEEQDKYDKLTSDLVVGMGYMLPFIDDIKDRAKVASLKNTITETLSLIEDASRFVIEYKSDGAAVRAVRAFTSTTAPEQVDEFVKRFNRLKQEFDRGLLIQIDSGIESLLKDSDREMLVKLMSPYADDGENAGCLEGTRIRIQTEIQQWVDSEDTTQPLFWLYGLAGCGKSTVARSVCNRLDEDNLLAGAFFCKRDSDHLKKPESVVSAIAAYLGLTYPVYGAKLVAALREKPQIVHSPFTTRFQEMITRPFRASDTNTRPGISVIVVDALDECGTASTRTQLLLHLFELSKLVPWLKIIVTSRPSDEVARFFQKEGKGVPCCDLFQEDPGLVFKDISCFIERRLMTLWEDNPELGPKTWLDDGTVGKLANQASGLFIWARTACNTICNSLAPKLRIKGMLSGEPLPDANEQLGLLYTTILKEALGGRVGDTDIITSCLAAVTLARTPLADTALSELLSEQVDLETLRILIRRLAAVLYRDSHGAIRVIHKSFSDYVVDRERCPVRYQVEENNGNMKLATSCMEIMIRELKFNICGLKDSGLFNRDVGGLKPRIQCKIRPHLEYSCLYWIDHLRSTPPFNTGSQQHQTIVRILEKLLLGARALYWIEVLSLLDRLHLSQTMLVELLEWMQNPSRTQRISQNADELQRFVAAFYLPISQSTPHLYISALSFGSNIYEEIGVVKYRFPNTLKISQGQQLGTLSKGRFRLTPHPNTVMAVAYSPDNRLIATGCGDALMRVWDARTGAPRYPTVEVHSDGVTSVAFSPDGQQIVSGSDDHTLQLWDAGTGETLLAPFCGHSDAVTSVAFSPDSEHIVSGSRDQTLRLWDARTGKSAPFLFAGHTDVVTGVCFSADSQRIVSVSYDNTVRLWNVATGDAAIDPRDGFEHGDHILAVAISPDGKRVMYGSLNGHLEEWGMPGLQSLPNLFGIQSGPVTSVGFSRNNKYLVTGSYDSTVRVYDIGSRGTSSNLFEGHSGRVTCVSFSPDGQHIASGSDDNTLRLWDACVGAANLSPLPGHSSSVHSVAFSPDGKYIVSGSSDKLVGLWDACNGTAVLDPFQGHSEVVTCVSFSPNGQRIVSGSDDKTVRLWDARNGDSVLAPLQGHSDSVRSVAFSPDGQHIISGSYDTTVRLWSAQTGDAMLDPLRGHSDRVSSVAFSPDGCYIASGSWDKTVQLWDACTGAAVLAPLQHSDSVMAVAFSPDSKHIVSGCDNNAVQLWDVHTGAADLEPSQGHTDVVNSVAFSPNGQYIVSASDDKTLRLWDARTGAAVLDPLRGHDSWMNSVAFSPDSKRIVSGSYDGTTRVWDISNLVTPPDTLPSDSLSSGLSNPHVSSYQLHDLLSDDGWVKDHDGKLLFWLPNVYRRTKPDHSVLVVSEEPSKHNVIFDFTKFKYGTEWTAVYDPAADEI